jgi:large subunit ribosomal protein L21
MYAVIVSGGKQYRVSEGEILKLEKLELPVGGTLEIDRVLLVANGEDVRIGTPVVDKARVSVQVLRHGRHDKIRIVKFRRRKHHEKQTGHRQWFTEVKVTGINAA